jgi:hypothetical protein
MGYDFNEMRTGLRKLQKRMKNLSRNELKSLAEAEPGFLDWLYFLGPDTAIIDWIRFRCDVITSSLKEFRNAAKEGNERIRFGSDSHPPSFAQLVGHRYSDFERYADFLSPLLPHPMIFSLLNFVEITEKLMIWNKSLKQSDVMPILYKLFGYEKLRLPTSINSILERKPIPATDYSHGRIDISKIYELEAAKVRAMVSGSKPRYGVLAANKMITPAGAASRVRKVLGSGMKGIIVQFGGMPGPVRNMKAVKRAMQD